MPNPRSPEVSTPAVGATLGLLGAAYALSYVDRTILSRAGLLVSDPVELAGPDGPMNQIGAHCVLENAYLEIAAPVGGKPNHLVPLLAHGPGLRILALDSADAAADHRRLDHLGLARVAVRESSRSLELAGGPRTARFRWFAAGPPVTGLLTVIVEHLDREIVFAPELRAHPRGLTRLESVVFGQPARGLECLAQERDDAPHSFIDQDHGAPIAALEFGGAPPLSLELGGALLTFRNIEETDHALR